MVNKSRIYFTILSFYPRKLATTKWSTIWQNTNSAKALSGDPENCEAFLGLVFMRRLAAKTKQATAEPNPARKAL